MRLVGVPPWYTNISSSVCAQQLLIDAVLIPPPPVGTWRRNTLCTSSWQASIRSWNTTPLPPCLIDGLPPDMRLLSVMDSKSRAFIVPISILQPPPVLAVTTPLTMVGTDGAVDILV